MKPPALSLGLLAGLLLAAAPPVEAEARVSSRVRVYGRDYVPLGSWAHANEFSSRWAAGGKRLELSGRRGRLSFTLNSCEATINGVAVWLCFPITVRGSSACISQLDLDQTLAPVLSPPANSPGIRVRTICLDAGHGGNDPGERAGWHEEQKYTLLLAREVRDLLREAGFNVVMTRNSDQHVDLSARTAIARARKADLFVSLHFNSSPTSRNTVKGVETYCATPAGATSTNARGEGSTHWVDGNRNGAKNMMLAYEVQRALTRDLGAEDRGVRRARFQVLREATMPAILIEGGFMSHPTEGQKIYDPAYRRQLARAIVDGLQAYKRTVKG